MTSALTATIPNIPPVASVGSDRSIDLPKNSIVLPGQGSDADGQVVSYLWTKKSGPAGGYITDANVAQSGASGLTEGVYVFNLTVTDNQGATADANLTITVNNGALPGILPVGFHPLRCHRPLQQIFLLLMQGMIPL